MRSFVLLAVALALTTGWWCPDAACAATPVEPTPSTKAATPGVELANAMLLSTWLDKTVELPIDAVAFQGLLEQQIKKSRFIKKTAAAATNEDFTKSFGR